VHHFKYCCLCIC